MGNPEHSLHSRGPIGLGISSERIADSRLTSFARDSARAANEEIFRCFIPSMSPTELIEEAREKSSLIMNDAAEGPRHHNAVVDTLFELRKALEKRILEAPVDKDTLLPVIPGIKWSPNDPLAPLVEVIDPFMLSNFWTKVPVPSDPVPVIITVKRFRRSTGSRDSSGKGTVSFKIPTKVKTTGIGRPFKTDQANVPLKALKEGSKELIQDIIVSTSIVLEIAVVFIQAYEYLKEWVTAKEQGLVIAERRVAAMVMASGIASMAMRVKPPVMEKKPAQVGQNFRMSGPGTLPSWRGIPLPEPNADGVREEIQQISAGWTYGHKKADVRRVVEKGRAMGLKLAREYVEKRNMRKDWDGYIFLWALKSKYKNLDDIQRYVAYAIRKEIQ